MLDKDNKDFVDLCYQHATHGGYLHSHIAIDVIKLVNIITKLEKELQQYTEDDLK